MKIVARISIATILIQVGWYILATLYGLSLAMTIAVGLVFISGYARGLADIQSVE